MKYAIVSVIGAVVIMGCIALSCAPPVAPETEPYQEIQYTEDIVVVIPEKTLVKGKYQRETDRPIRRWVKTGMPCDLYQGETDEQETGEETEGTVREEGTSTTGQDGYEVVEQSVQADSHQTQETQTVCDTVPVPEETQNATEVAGSEVSANVQQTSNNTECGLEECLRQCLESAGVGWFYPYAYAQIMQESRWNPNAVNSNGLDYGLLQYRITYWREPEPIMDPYAQIRKYVSQVSARIAAGLSIEEIISRHITSDYVTEINWEYVNLVLSHMN